MVRQKQRWLLVRLHFQRKEDAESITTKDIDKSLRHSISQNFGSFLSGRVENDLRVLFYDPKLRLTMIRVGREMYRHVRAAVALMFHITDKRSLISLSVVAVNGSLRTAKLSTLIVLKNWFWEKRCRYADTKNDDGENVSKTSVLEKSLNKYYQKKMNEIFLMS